MVVCETITADIGKEGVGEHSNALHSKAPALLLNRDGESGVLLIQHHFGAYSDAVAREQCIQSAFVLGHGEALATAALERSLSLVEANLGANDPTTVATAFIDNWTTTR